MQALWDQQYIPSIRVRVGNLSILDEWMNKLLICKNVNHEVENRNDKDYSSNCKILLDATFIYFKTFIQWLQVVLHHLYR